MAKIKGWKKVKENSKISVWSNSKKRVIVQKGLYNWVSWVEKDIGKIGTDDAFIPNAYLTIDSTSKIEAEKKAIKYMRRHEG